MDAVAKTINRKVHIVDTAETELAGEKHTPNSFINVATNEYYIPLNDVDVGMLYFAMHENIHDIAKNNPEGFDGLADVVFDVFGEKDIDLWETLEVQKELYPNKSEEYLLEEIVANTVPVILNDKATADMFVSRVVEAGHETRTTFEKILNAISKFLKKAYNKLKTSASWAQMQAIENDMDAIARIRDAYFKALDGMQDSNAEGDGNKYLIEYDAKNAKYKCFQFLYNHGEGGCMKFENGKWLNFETECSENILDKDFGEDWWCWNLDLVAEFDFEKYPEILCELQNAVRKYISKDQIDYCERTWEDGDLQILVSSISWSPRKLRVIQDFLDEINAILLPIKDECDCYTMGDWHIVHGPQATAAWEWIDGEFKIIGAEL